MKLAFFVDGSVIEKKINDKRKELLKEVFNYVLYFFIPATAILIILGVLRVKQIAFKMTAQIIFLYETLY